MGGVIRTGAVEATVILSPLTLTSTCLLPFFTRPTTSVGESLRNGGKFVGHTSVTPAGSCSFGERSRQRHYFWDWSWAALLCLCPRSLCSWAVVACFFAAGAGSLALA